MNKEQILTTQQIDSVISHLHAEHKKIVLAGGCFDILHIGHIQYLDQAKKQGDILIVLLESDASIRKRKGLQRPIHTQRERAYMISSLCYVDFVICLPDNMQDSDYESLTKQIQPAIIAATSHDPHVIYKQKQAKMVGAEVIYVNAKIEKVSTSSIIEILQKEM